VPTSNNGKPLKGFAINMLLGSLLKFEGALPCGLQLDTRNEWHLKKKCIIGTGTWRPRHGQQNLDEVSHRYQGNNYFIFTGSIYYFIVNNQNISPTVIIKDTTNH
jgi:hypothetical protein